MRSIPKLALLILFLITGTKVTAQDRAPILSGENVAEGIQVYEYVREMNDELTSMGTITEKVEVQDNRMLITYIQDLPRVILKDSLLVEYDSFIPVTYRSVIQNRQNITVNYTDTKSASIRVKRRSFGVNQDTTYSTTFNERRYDSHWLPTLVYGIDKGGDGKSSIPVYSSNNKKDIVTIEEQGEEQVTLNGQMYETLKYVISRKNSENKYYYWIAKETGRMLQTRGEESEGMIVWLRIKPQV